MKLFIALLLTGLSVLAQASQFTTEKWTTSQGTRVVFYRAMEVPMLDISLAFAAGSARDAANFGLNTLTSSLLNQGNAGMDVNQIASSLEDTGAQFDAQTNRDMALLNLRTLTKPEALTKAIDIFTKIATAPDFPAEAFNREKQLQLLAIKQSFESPDDVANQTFFKHLYANHPYGHPVVGTRETVEKLTRDQVLQFYKQYYVSKNSILIMVGAISSEQAHQIAEQITKPLAQGQPAPRIASASALQRAETVHIPFPASQTMIRLGQLGITHQDPDFFPLTVGNFILGGGALTSILGLEIREKQGLTYGIYSQFMALMGTGPFLINLSTKNDQATHALDVTRQLLNDYLQKGPDEKQLLAAKQYITGNFALSLASNRNIANTLLKMAFYQLPDDYLDTYIAKVNQVTRESIKEAFIKHIQASNMLTVTVGKS